MAYNVMLKREPDPGGLAHYATLLRSGQMTGNEELTDWLRGSEEFATRHLFTVFGPSLHASRCQFIRSLPRARRILDLGGTHLAKDEGAFVALGYPYRFDKLVIVDLPPDERHPLYQGEGGRRVVKSRLGPVHYRYHSMADLSDYDDGSFDLVYSGQSIEHVTEEEGTHVLKEVARVLSPGGYLAVDTPNGRVTRLHQAELIDPDHEVEYTHGELLAKFADAGLEVIEAKGLNFLGEEGVTTNTFSMGAVAGNSGVFASIEDCYLLAYLCQKPGAQLF